MKIGNPVAGLVLLAGLCVGSNCSAAYDVPNLVGTWIGDCRGEAFHHIKDGEHSNPHRDPGYSTVEFEFSITSQDGHIARGTTKSAKGTQNDHVFITRNGADPRFPYRIDYTSEFGGHGEGFLVGNRIYFLYRHSSASDTTISVCVWTKKS